MSDNEDVYKQYYIKYRLIRISDEELKKFQTIPLLKNETDKFINSKKISQKQIIVDKSNLSAEEELLESRYKFHNYVFKIVNFNSIITKQTKNYMNKISSSLTTNIMEIDD